MAYSEEEEGEKDTSYREILKTDKFKESFEKKFRKNNAGCWIWTASRDKDDYGQVAVGLGKGRIKRAHRVAYELYTGEVIPEGMELDHTCHIRRCVNVDHLEVVTRQENMKNLRRTEDWAVGEDEFQRKKTTPERFLEDVKGIIERSGVRIPELSGGGKNKGYSVETLTDTPWRDISIEEGYIPQDKFSLIKLFLDCLRVGVKVEDAVEILGVSPWTINNWTTKNEEFRYDVATAKRAGRKYRYESIEDKHLDELERKIDFAEFKDVATSLKHLREQDEDRIAAKKNVESGGNLPNITIVFGGGNPEKVLRSLVEMGDSIEAEFEVVEPKALKEGDNASPDRDTS